MKKIGVFLLSFMVLVGCQTSKEKGAEEQATEEVIKQREEITENLTNRELTRLNEYLSNLSQAGFLSYDKQHQNQMQLLNLGFILYAYEGKIPTIVEVEGAYYNPFNYNEITEKLNLYVDC